MTYPADRFCRACGQQMVMIRVPRDGFSELTGKPNYERWSVCPDYRQEQHGWWKHWKGNGHDSLRNGIFWATMSDMDYVLWMSTR